MCDITEKSIREKMESLAKKIERLQALLEAATRERDALSMTLAIFQPPPPKSVQRKMSLDVSPDELRGKALNDALIIIAERNDGVLPSTPAREMLVEAGVLRGSQTGNALWLALDRSKRFTRESKGRYRLVDDPDEMPGSEPVPIRAVGA